MVGERTGRRDVLRGIGALGTTGTLAAGAAASTGSAASTAAEPPALPHVRATYRALVDAVVPRTPELAGELGDEHVAGGLEVGLDEFLPTFVDGLFSAGVPGVGDVGTLPLSDVVAVALDLAATTLVAAGENARPPSIGRVLEVLDVESLLDVRGLVDDPSGALERSLFAGLSREDRLRAIERLDAIDLDTAVLPGPVAEIDAALLGQLVVGFTEFVYYGEWQGYDDATAPPSERSFDGDVQGWEQTDFQGVIDGAAALRGYWGRPDGSLGAGAVWDVVRLEEGWPATLQAEPGAFEENEYDTSGYAEPYATDGTPATDGPIGDVVDAVAGDAGDEVDTGNPVGDLLEGLLGIGNPDSRLVPDLLGVGR